MRGVLVVPGAAVWLGGQPSPSLERRTRRAVALWQTGEYDLVIPSGGLGRHPPTEAQVMHDILCSEGIPKEAIRCDQSATTTFQTARYVAAMLAGETFERVHAVTDRSHAVRTWIAFRAYGLPVQVRTTAGFGPRSRLSIQIVQWLREIPATLYYIPAAILIFLFSSSI